MSKKFTTRDELEDKYGQLMFDCECYLENSIEIVLNYLDSVRNSSNFYEAKEVVSIVLSNLENCVENLLCFEKEINRKAYSELSKYKKENAYILDDEEDEAEDEEEKYEEKKTEEIYSSIKKSNNNNNNSNNNSSDDNSKNKESRKEDKKK